LKINFLAFLTKTNTYEKQNDRRTLALFLGGLGMHKFYLGKWVWGLIYLIFAGRLSPHSLALSKPSFSSSNQKKVPGQIWRFCLRDDGQRLGPRDTRHARQMS
jgi:TM2 domain-containing membrane protein YozV